MKEEDIELPDNVLVDLRDNSFHTEDETAVVYYDTAVKLLKQAYAALKAEAKGQDELWNNLFEIIDNELLIIIDNKAGIENLYNECKKLDKSTLK